MRRGAFGSLAHRQPSGSISSNESDMPPGLTEGVDAVALGETDNGVYDHTSSVTSGTKAELLAAINNKDNWVLSNSLPLSVSYPVTGTFSLSLSPPPPSAPPAPLAPPAPPTAPPSPPSPPISPPPFTASCTDANAFYAGVSTAMTPTQLELTLHNRISAHTVVSYDSAWDALADLDAAPTDASRVVPIRRL